jgi:hypothetical protein
MLPGMPDTSATCLAVVRSAIALKAESSLPILLQLPVQRRLANAELLRSFGAVTARRLQDGGDVVALHVGK